MSYGPDVRVAYFTLRAWGRAQEVAAASLGISERTARNWEKDPRFDYQRSVVDRGVWMAFEVREQERRKKLWAPRDL